MSKYQRTKGANAERDAAKLWQAVGYNLARRKLSQYQEKCGVDLENTGKYKVQVKSGKNINVWKALSEAISDTKPDEIPVAMAKKDREDWILVMRWKDFATLCLSQANQQSPVSLPNDYLNEWKASMIRRVNG